MKIGDRVLVRGTVDEIRNDCVIIRNEGGYFGTVESEVIEIATDAVPVIRCKDCVNRGTMYINMEPVKWRCMISDSVVDMMDYCSFGERKEENG